MVKIRTATVASVALLLGTTLSAALAEDSWGDMAQYSAGSSVSQQQQQQSTDAPATWEASKKSDDETAESSGEDKKSQKSGDKTDAPSTSWTQVPSSGDKDTTESSKQGSGNYWNQGPTPSWGSSKKSDNDGDDKSDSSSTGANQSTQPPSTSESSGKSGDDNNNDVGSSKSSKTSEPNEDSWKQESVTSSGASQTSGETTSSSTGSQTTGGGGGGGNTTPSTSGGSVPDGTWPTSAGTVQFAEAHVVKAGEVFDGKMKTYERSDVTCGGQKESGWQSAVFMLEPGSTLKNVIIGKNQMEGVHCDKHDCTIENVWWDDVCEDALSVKGGTASSVTTVTGGGARSADDKVIQHNGFGTVKIDGFYGEDISKLYRSCGTCGDKQRKVSVSNVYVVNPGNAIVTVNKNWKDEATLSNIWVKSAGKKKVKICQWSQGNADGEPSMLGDGPSPPLCQYSESDVHLNGDVSKAGGSTPSQGSTPVTPSEGSDSDQLPGTVAPDVPESSGNDDDGSPSQQTPESPATSSDGSADGGDDKTSESSGADDTKTWSQAASKSSDENGDSDKKEKDISSKSSNGDSDKKEKETSSKSSKGDKKSDNTESDSALQQDFSTGDESVMQSEVGGEADLTTPTAVESEAGTKESAFGSTTTTSTSKCNIRRRRN